MIVFDHVSYSRNGRMILKDINFTVNDGERVAILGGSGEGKTTILKLILVLFRADGGRVIIDGRDVTREPEEKLMDVRRMFSIVFQDGALFDSLNVRENVAFYLREYTDLNEEQIEERVRELLRIVSVEEAIYLMPEELSGGMQRRVAIARSLAAHESKFFLYDEPTSDLDPVNAANIRKLILDLAQNGSGFIMVTHEMFDAMQVAQRFMFLKDGVLMFDGGRSEMLTSDVPGLRMFMDQWKSGLS